MQGAVDRVLALERALEDVRFAHRLLVGSIGVDEWCGPARSAFDEALAELPALVRTAEAALDRERGRAMLRLTTSG